MVTSVASGTGGHDAPRHTNGSAAPNLRQRRKHAAAGSPGQQRTPSWKGARCVGSPIEFERWLRDRNGADCLFAEMMEVERGVEHLWNERWIRRDPLGNEIGRALSVPDLVSSDPGQQVGEDMVFGLLAEAAEEIVSEVLGEHEFDEPRNELAR